MLQREIKDSSDELDKISPIYDNQVLEEKEISKGFVYIWVSASASIYFHLPVS